jgi:hypothetical protein
MSSTIEYKPSDHASSSVYVAALYAANSLTAVTNALVEDESRPPSNTPALGNPPIFNTFFNSDVIFVLKEMTNICALDSRYAATAGFPDTSSATCSRTATNGHGVPVLPSKYSMSSLPRTTTSVTVTHLRDCLLVSGLFFGESATIREFPGA